MNRRAFLSAATTGCATTTAGCLGGDGVDDLGYERCTSSFIPLYEFPTEVSTEIETALRDDEYTADELTYPEIVAEDSILWDTEQNRYYEHHVHADDSFLGRGETMLTFEEVTPTRGQPPELTVSNQTDDAVDVSVTIAEDGGEAVITDELTVEPTDWLNEVESVSSGEYVGRKGEMLRAPGLECPNELQDYEVVLETNSSNVSTSHEAIVSVTPRMEHFFVQIGSDGIVSGEIWENSGFFQSQDELDSKDGQNWACATPLGGWPEEN